MFWWWRSWRGSLAFTSLRYCIIVACGLVFARPVAVSVVFVSCLKIGMWQKIFSQFVELIMDNGTGSSGSHRNKRNKILKNMVNKDYNSELYTVMVAKALQIRHLNLSRKCVLFSEKNKLDIFGRLTSKRRNQKYCKISQEKTNKAHLILNVTVQIVFISSDKI